MSDQILTSAEQLAIAVLRGDESAIAPLVDCVLETIDGTKKIVRPLKHITNLERLKIVAFVDPAFGPDVQVDVPGLNKAISNWLLGSTAAVEALVLVGMNRIEMYELPEPKKMTDEEVEESTRRSLQNYRCEIVKEE